MRYSISRLLTCVSLFCLVLVVYPIEAGPTYRCTTALAIALCMLIAQLNNTFVIALQVTAAVLGVVVVGPILRDSLFAVRDGYYYFDSVLPGRIWGAIFGW